MDKGEERFKERLNQQQRQCLTSQVQRLDQLFPQYAYNASITDPKEDINSNIETPATYIASSPESSQLPNAKGAFKHYSP